MATPLILASSSTIRRQLLESAGLSVQTVAARIDEDMIRDSLIAEGATPRDIADSLAEMKAIRVAERHADAVIIGCDQVLEFQDKVWAKPESLQQAQEQLGLLRGNTHRLLSAIVVCHQGQPVWRHVGTARLTMRDFSESYLAAYLARNWPSVGQSVGAYKLEEEGIRLFSAIEGDHFTILGLPLLPLLSYLTLRGFIEP
ncbi:Maf family protein [Fuscibacter oryzae]|uniref:Nucleoside triphosphate pyrophosphatase n=1 Tax=Fuscibacter oryzae TaxID=2803939 RepID=A0A8J7MWL8_9RHOB|nr:Maf family protein [Fuscibacter oryzae]MBL4929059.1 Maf family protein [Fuscibacter oryzae]